MHVTSFIFTSDAKSFYDGLVYFLIILCATLTSIEYITAYKIDKTFKYSVILAIVFLIIAFFLIKYLFPAIAAYLF